MIQRREPKTLGFKYSNWDISVLDLICELYNVKVKVMYYLFPKFANFSLQMRAHTHEKIHTWCFLCFSLLLPFFYSFCPFGFELSSYLCIWIWISSIAYTLTQTQGCLAATNFTRLFAMPATTSHARSLASPKPIYLVSPKTSYLVSWRMSYLTSPRTRWIALSKPSFLTALLSWKACYLYFSLVKPKTKRLLPLNMNTYLTAFPFWSSRYFFWVSTFFLSPSHLFSFSQPTWVGMVVLAWNLEVLLFSRSQGFILSMPISVD